MENNLLALKHFVQTLEKYLFNTDIIIAGIPLANIIVSAIIITFTQLLTGLFTFIILRIIAYLTRKTTTQMDDKLIDLLRQPLKWSILLAGLWLVKLVIADNLSPEYLQVIDNLFQLAAVIVGAYIVYNAAPLFGQFLRNLTLKTNNELDNLLYPYIPRIFRIAAILIVIIKGNEVFLGCRSACRSFRWSRCCYWFVAQRHYL